MRKLAFAVLSSLLWVTVARAQPPALVYDVLPTIWLVDAAQAGTGGRTRNLGTGVMVAPDRIVTNCHVTANSWHVTVINAATQKTLPVTLEAYDTPDDLCLLVVPGAGSQVASLAQDDSPEVGTAVTVVGFPLGRLSYSEGKVLSLSPFYGHTVIRASAVCNRGNSGGPMFNEHGELIGINAFITKEYRGCNAIRAHLISSTLRYLTPLELHATAGDDYFEHFHQP